MAGTTKLFGAAPSAAAPDLFRTSTAGTPDLFRASGGAGSPSIFQSEEGSLLFDSASGLFDDKGGNFDEVRS